MTPYFAKFSILSYWFHINVIFRSGLSVVRIIILSLATKVTRWSDICLFILIGHKWKCLLFHIKCNLNTTSFGGSFETNPRLNVDGNTPISLPSLSLVGISMFESLQAVQVRPVCCLRVFNKRNKNTFIHDSSSPLIHLESTSLKL